MRTVTKIGLAVLVGGGAVVYALVRYAQKQKALLEQFEYKIVDLRFEKFTPQLLKGNVVVKFTSISDVEITIEQFYLELFFNEKYVGYIEDKTPFVIPAKGFNNISFDFTLNPQLILGNITDIFAYTFNQKDAAIKVTGFAKIKSGFVRATLPITYETTVREILAD